MQLIKRCSITGSLSKLSWLSRISYGGVLLSGFLILGLLVYNSYATIARYLFNAPPVGSTEISSIMIPVIIFLALAYTLEKRKHIVMDVFTSRLSERNQLTLSTMAVFVIIVVSVVFIWKGGQLAFNKLHENSPSQVGFPLFPFYIAVPIGGVLLFFQAVIQAVNGLHSLAKRELSLHEKPLAGNR